MVNIAEICCGSLEDALIAEKAGCDRIELNQAMFLSGLTPSPGTVELVSEHCSIPIVVMVRPRPGGFYYNDYEFQTMLKDIEFLLNYDIEGIVFGCLDEHGEIDLEKTKMIVNLIHRYNKDAIFHRAFDCVNDPFQAIEVLIDLGVKRVLTGGLRTRAMDGIQILKELQDKYSEKIEILAGGGVTAENVAELMKKTNIKQFHSSCTGWRKDPTTRTEHISFAFAPEPSYRDHYNMVDYEKAVKFVKAVKEL